MTSIRNSAPGSIFHALKKRDQILAKDVMKRCVKTGDQQETMLKAKKLDEAAKQYRENKDLLTEEHKRILQELDFEATRLEVPIWKDSGKILTDVTSLFGSGAKALIGGGIIVGIPGLLLAHSRKMLGGVFLCGSIALLFFARVASTISKGASLQLKNIEALTVENFCDFGKRIAETYTEIKKMNWFISAYLGEGAGSKLLREQINTCNQVKAKLRDTERDTVRV